MITDQQLVEWNRQGLIPAPHESEADFATRALYCLGLQEQIGKELQADLGEEMSGSSALLAAGREKTKRLYDIESLWIPVFFSDYRLFCWHGGCAWIFQVAEDKPLGALLQLRKKFRSSETYLGLYHRDELTAHEMAHVGRMAFEEPQFEEIFAYKTSSSAFRRWFGPLIQSSIESMLFLILLGLLFFVDISLILLGHPDAYHTVMWLKLIPLGLLAGSLLRLWKRQQHLFLCLSHLKECLGSEEKALAVAYRLSDKEVRDFSKMTASAILEYSKEQKMHSVRWRAIVATYF